LGSDDRGAPLSFRVAVSTVGGTCDWKSQCRWFDSSPGHHFEIIGFFGNFGPQISFLKIGRNFTTDPWRTLFSRRPPCPSQADSGRTRIHPSQETHMRMLAILIAVLSLLAVTACSGSGDDSGQSHRGQTGPYIGGSGGAGF
jgi:hypothetical protein